MTSSDDWRTALGDMLDAVALEDDTFALDLHTAKDATGAPLTALLPQEALRTEGDDLDEWWTDTEGPQSAVWMRHGWDVIRADPRTMTVAFARLDGEWQGRG